MYTEEQIQIMKFFALLFGKANGGYVEPRSTDYAGSPDMEKRRWIPANQQEEFADAALELKDQYHVYFGVATRTEEGKNTSQFLRELTCLYSELDGDDYEGGISETSEKLACFRTISIVINSGHGLHSYWLLDKPYDLNRSRAKLQTLLKVLRIKELGADKIHVALLLKITHLQGIINWLEKARLGDVKVSPHILRRTAATMAVRNGMGTFALKRFFGWESIKTAMKYVHMGDQTVKEAFKKSSPIDGLEESG